MDYITVTNGIATNLNDREAAKSPGPGAFKGAQAVPRPNDGRHEAVNKTHQCTSIASSLSCL